MTVVAGALLPDGAMIAADCRISWRSPKGALHTDTAIKLVKLGTATIVGYSGDVQTVQYLLPHLLQGLDRRRTDPISIARWLPRFLRRTYRALARWYPIGPVDFMVAASLRGKPTRVQRGLLWSSVEGMRSLEAANWLAARCYNELASGTSELIAVPASSEGLLYAMQSPEFVPVICPPLSVLAIGSGHRAVEYLDRFAPLIMCGRPDRACDRFLDALSSYFIESNDSTIGGAVLMAHAVDGRVHSLPYRQDMPDGQYIEIKQEGHRFSLHNSRTGRTVPLRYPSEILGRPPVVPLVFDDFKDALEPYREQIRQLNEEITVRLNRFYSGLADDSS
jgi:hypothetical protein